MSRDSKLFSDDAQCSYRSPLVARLHDSFFCIEKNVISRSGDRVMHKRHQKVALKQNELV